MFSPLFIFFFNDTATTEIYTLSLHDALPILQGARDLPGGVPQRGGHHPRGDGRAHLPQGRGVRRLRRERLQGGAGERESTRLNSNHAKNSVAGFFFKKKKKKNVSMTSSTVSL